MTEKPVLLEATRGGVAVVTLNRPHVHNAFNPEVIEALADIFDELKGADGVRCVMIEGAGESFSAGADIEWMRFAGDYTFDDNVRDARALAHMLHALRSLPQPSIAFVHGAAIGGGAGLVAAADIAIADRSAVFAFSEVRLGIVPGAISPYVIDAIGPRAARRYFLTGERFDAEEARRIGLVHAVVEDRQGLAALGEAIVGAVFAGAPGAIAAAKELIDAVQGRVIDGALINETARRIAERRASAEGKEGLKAFLEKRKPGWFEE